MGRSVRRAGHRPEEQERGISPFTGFGIAIAVGAGWALLMGLEYYDTPTFTVAALPTLAGIAVALVVFFVIGLLAPPNE